MSSAGGMLLAVDGVPASVNVRKCRPVLLAYPHAHCARTAFHFWSRGWRGQTARDRDAYESGQIKLCDNL